MNMLETKLRAALRETGEEIAPGTAPRLHLPGARRRPGLPVIRRRWSAWLAPVAAAASVAAVVAASLAIASTFHGHARDTGQSQAAAAHGSPPGPASALRLAPPYFVQLSQFNDIQGARQAAVRSTVTGRILAKVTPPRPYGMFSWVSGAADDRTFILAAQRYWPIASGSAGASAQTRDIRAPTFFFRLTFGPHTGSARLTRLPVPELIHSSDLGGMAFSPDGTRLALDLRQSIQVVTLATGAIRTWVWPGTGWAGNWKPHGQIFSWSADGRYLEFQSWGGDNDETMSIRVLDTRAPGATLAAARVIVTFPFNRHAMTSVTSNSFLTPDGTRVVASTDFFRAGNRSADYEQITGYSLAGRPVFTEDRFSLGDQEVLWAGPHGNVLVVLDPRGKRNQYGPGTILGVLAGNRFTPIPHGATETDQIAW